MTELRYEPDKWNQNIFIRKSHNCYSYALNLIEVKRTSKCKKKKTVSKKNICLRKHPMDKMKQFEFHSCSELISSILEEFPKIKKVHKLTLVPDGYYRVALFLLNRKDHHHLSLNDFHFYRQDSNGYWSHKDGWRKATNKDKTGKLITDPESVEKKNNSQLCTYFIFPIRKT